MREWLAARTADAFKLLLDGPAAMNEVICPVS
jgi:hypothetical protein